MVENLLITPVESVVLGLCVGEYTDHDLRGEASGYSFECFLERRFSWFVPTLRSQTGTVVHQDDVPQDVVWVEFETSNFGISEAKRNVLFLQDENGCTRIELDRSRRSLLDQLLVRLGDSLALALADRFFCVLESSFDGDWQRLARALRGARDKWAVQFERGTDNPKAIERTISELVRFNECEDLFEIGCCFGELASSFDRLARWVFFCDGDESEDVTGDLLGPLIERLLETNIVRHNLAACDLLKRVLDFPPSIELRSYEGVRDHMEAQRAVWLAFGEVVSVLRDVDLQVRRRDWSAPVPRAFGVTPPDDADRIRTEIRMVEQQLAEKPLEEGMQWRIVSPLVPFIEGMANRVWPTELSVVQDQQSVLMTVLHNKSRRQNPDENERRFANIALSLHKSYRNIVSHDPDGFHCSLEESRFFVAGVRVLLDLSDRLLQK